MKTEDKFHSTYKIKLKQGFENWAEKTFWQGYRVLGSFLLIFHNSGHHKTRSINKIAFDSKVLSIAIHKNKHLMPNFNRLVVSWLVQQSFQYNNLLKRQLEVIPLVLSAALKQLTVEGWF